jgi:hypothetical protein
VSAAHHHRDSHHRGRQLTERQSLVSNRFLGKVILSVGICTCAAALVNWIRGGFDPVRPPLEAAQPVWHPRREQPAEFKPEETTIITPAMALQLIMLGKTGSFSVPGIVQPAVEPATSAAVPDTAEIIGVVVNGCARAYCISEMHNPLAHIVNDVIDRVPVTVTFCNRSGCARVLTKPDVVDRPLDVGVGGFADGQMLLHIDSRNIPVDSRDIPLQDLEFETTTWFKWKSAHPDTDVCRRLTPVSFLRTPRAVSNVPTGGDVVSQAAE